MLDHLRLTWLERIALKMLTRSPRVGLLVLKPYGSRLAYIAKDQSDPVDIVETEPLSMQLERLYHQPSYGEDE